MTMTLMPVAATRPSGQPAGGRNKLLASLPADVFDLIQPELKQATFAKGGSVWAAGAHLEKVYFPDSGAIALQVLLNDGGAFATAVVGAEGALGLGMHRSLAEATVCLEGTLSMMPIERFEALAEQHKPLRDLTRICTDQMLTQIQQIAVCRVSHNASARLARWLLQMSDRSGDELPLTQEDLAKFVGVRRTSVTLDAQELQRKGGIRYSRGRIVIADRDELTRCACECYAALAAFDGAGGNATPASADGALEGLDGESV